jgi:hypothetical protein
VTSWPTQIGRPDPKRIEEGLQIYARVVGSEGSANQGRAFELPPEDRFRRITAD